ncbi:hypothetical protein Tco_0744963 [Tanacetum coccineum]
MRATNEELHPINWLEHFLTGMNDKRNVKAINDIMCASPLSVMYAFPLSIGLEGEHLGLYDTNALKFVDRVERAMTVNQWLMWLSCQHM